MTTTTAAAGLKLPITVLERPDESGNDSDFLLHDADREHIAVAFDLRVAEAVASALNTATAMREALEQCAEALALARDKLGMAGEGDGKDRKGDAVDSIGSRSALQAARTALASPAAVPEVPQGWKIVPVEPTKEMILAGATADAAWIKEAEKGSPYPAVHGPIYRAMLSASPTPPTQARPTITEEQIEAAAHIAAAEITKRWRAVANMTDPEKPGDDTAWQQAEIETAKIIDRIFAAALSPQLKPLADTRNEDPAR